LLGDFDYVGRELVGDALVLGEELLSFSLTRLQHCRVLKRCAVRLEAVDDAIDLGANFTQALKEALTPLLELGERVV
jgi:hypothetical protein